MNKAYLLQSWREYAKYDDCVLQARKESLQRKLEHWCSDKNVEESFLLRSVFPMSRRPKHHKQDET